MKLEKIICTLALFLAYRAPAIINGKLAAPGESPEVVFLESPSNMVCSATLVGPRVVLTAAACAHTGTATVTIGERKYTGYFMRSPFFPSRDHDLALGVLEQEVVGVKPAVIADSLVKEGQQVTLAGFGCGEDSGVSAPLFDNKLRLGTSVVSGFQDVYAVSVGSEGALVCYHDNGGPVFVPSEGGRRIVAVSSFGDRKTKNYAIRLDHEFSRGFLEYFAKENNVDICGINADCK